MDSQEDQTKKPSKKEAAKAERLRRKQELAAASAAASGVSAVSIDEADPLAANYGEIPLIELQSNEVVSTQTWTEVGSLDQSLKDANVLIRGRVHNIRAVSKNMAFLVVRERGFTVQCVLTVKPEVVSTQMVKFVTNLNKESFVDVHGIVSVPVSPLKATTQQVEIQVSKIYCVNKALPTLPISIEDAARSEVEIEAAQQAGEHFVRVNQDTRLNNRCLDLRTPANQSIFHIQFQVEEVMLRL